MNITDIRIGHGYDVHRLVEGRRLVLGGVEIPHTMGLDGHSDADVLLHALCDAMLGALALGDIGRHFPDNDDKYLGISSLILIERVTELCRKEGYVLSNCDITVLAQRPKLAPHIDKMRENISHAVGAPTDRISVKATTEERLGFTGREEGIASHAVVIMVKE